MSHFSVLVIGEDVEGQLAPYHQFECTGIDDQYVIDIDITQELRERFETETVTRRRDPEGLLHFPYEDRFYREPTEEELKKIGPSCGTGSSSKFSWLSKDWNDGKGYRVKVCFCPEGFEDVKVPYAEIMSFLEFVEYQTSKSDTVADVSEIDIKDKHKYGHILAKDGEVVHVISRTNPNAKWDWCQIGGRWSGFFKMKPGKSGKIGMPGLRTERVKPAGYADSALKGDIDFKGMVVDYIEEQLGHYQKFHAVVNGRVLPQWEEVKAKHGEDIEAARREWSENEIIKDLNKADFFLSLEQYQVEEAEFVHRAKQAAISTFAVVSNSVWYEKGSMGWWGCVKDEKESEEWLEQFYALLQELPEDTLLTVVDCHI